MAGDQSLPRREKWSFPRIRVADGPRHAAGQELPGYICFSAQDWWYHNRAHSDIQLMRRLAESRNVLFVNSITMRMPIPGRTTKFLRRLYRKAHSIARQLQCPVPELPNFWVLTPLIIPFYGSPMARRVNAALVRMQVARAARKAGIGKEPIYFVTIPTAWDVVRTLPRRGLVFNRSDKHSTFGEANSDYIRSLEDELLAKANHIVYVNRALMAVDAPSTGDRATFLDHGVDLEHFATTSNDHEPDDVRLVPHPRVGFFGGLDEYLVDFDLLYRLACEIPEAQLVLIGDASGSMRRFEALPNVHWLGFRSYEEIPALGATFDVALMPWLQNEWIAYSNPIKLKEYLALGLRVVTTDFSEAHRYRDLLHIAADADDFITLVRTALAEPDSVERQQERRAAVSQDSWDQRARDLIAISEADTGTPGA